MKFAKGIFITFGTSLLCLVLLIATNIIIARLLGPEGKGIIAVLGRSNEILLAFGQFGITTILLHYIGRKDVDIEDIVGNVLFVTICSSVLFIGGFWVFYDLWGQAVYEGIDPLFLVLTLATLPLGIVSLFFNRILQLRQRIIQYNLTLFVGSLLSLSFVFLMIFVFNKGVLGCCEAFLVAKMLSTALVAYWVFSLLGRIGKVNFRLLKEMIRNGVIIQVAVVMATLGDWIGLFIVMYYMDLKSVGWYVTALGFARLTLFISTSLRMMLQSKMAPEVENERVLSSLTITVVQHTIIWMFLACVGLAIGGKILIGIMYGEVFYPSYKLLLFVIPGVFANGIAKVLSSYLIAMGKFAVLTVIGGFSLSLNLCLLLLLVPEFGMIGAAFSISIYYIIQFLLITYNYLEYSKEKLRALLPKRETFLFYRGFILKVL